MQAARLDLPAAGRPHSSSSKIRASCDGESVSTADGALICGAAIATSLEQRTSEHASRAESSAGLRTSELAEGSSCAAPSDTLLQSRCASWTCELLLCSALLCCCRTREARQKNWSAEPTALCQLTPLDTRETHLTRRPVARESLTIGPADTLLRSARWCRDERAGGEGEQRSEAKHSGSAAAHSTTAATSFVRIC